MFCGIEYASLDVAKYGIKATENWVSGLTVKFHKFWDLLYSSHDEMNIREH